MKKIILSDLHEHRSEINLSAGELLVVDLADGGHWYGHGFSHVQPYPLECGEIENEIFAVNNIQCPVWMCSMGVVLYADTTEPLHVSINNNGDGQLRIGCMDKKLLVRVFKDLSLPKAHVAWLHDLGWPNQPPDISSFSNSLFCTWTQYPRCITQERILDMARNIRKNGYPCHTILIDDRWERCFGEMEFSPYEFPDPRSMFKELHELGFDAWLWVTPFVNQEAVCFSELAKDNILVPNLLGDNAALLKWWGGTAGLVDVTAPKGREWYRKKLLGLLELGACGFKIDGGDYKYHPPAHDCNWHSNPGASGYSDQLLELFEELVPNRCETRTAWCSQSRSILWREGGKDSHWGLDNGLKSMVSLGLHLGLMGYDLLIPDMVPGRVQTMAADAPLPTDELMVRWTEVSAFFPFLQFSYFPWNYSSSTSKVIQEYANVHKVLGNYLFEQASNRCMPLLRPLWYDFPEQKALYTIADEFLLGSDLLVAPILDEDTIHRDIHLPPGDWLDAWTGECVAGTLRSWSAPCPGIPVFVHTRNPQLQVTLASALQSISRGSVATGKTTAKWHSGLNRDLNITG